jgi:Protein of unknown function (DUF1266)
MISVFGGLILLGFSTAGFAPRRHIPPLSPEQQMQRIEASFHGMDYLQPVLILICGVVILLACVPLVIGQALGLIAQGGSLVGPTAGLIFGLLACGAGAFGIWRVRRSAPTAPVPAPVTEARDDREARLMAMGAMYIELDNMLDHITALLGDQSTPAERKELIIYHGFGCWDLVADDAAQACRRSLAEGWNITDNASLVERLEWLLREGHQTRFERFVAALDASGGDKEAMRAQLSDAMDADDFDGAFTQAVFWRPHLTAGGILAWDLARYVHVLRHAYNAGYIDEGGCWTFLDRLEAPAARIASWQEFAHSYLAGYEFWSGELDLERREIVGRLLQHPCSPWLHFPWPQTQPQ